MSSSDIIKAVRYADSLKKELPSDMSQSAQAAEILGRYKKTLKPLLKACSKNELIDLCSKSRIEVAILQHLLEQTHKQDLKPEVPASTELPKETPNV